MKLACGFSGNFMNKVKDIVGNLLEIYGKLIYFIIGLSGTIILIVIGNSKFNSDGILSDIFTLSGFGFWIVLGILFSITGYLANFFDLKKVANDRDKYKDIAEDINSLLEEVDNLKNDSKRNRETYLKLFIKKIFQDLHLSYNERITIYYENEDYFQYLARYSDNPLFCEMNRNRFPKGNGVIDLAWQRGEYFDLNQCPDANNDIEGYLNYMKDTYKYNKNIAKHLRMKSINFFAYAIKVEDKNRGVIVIESVNNEILNHRKLEELSEKKKSCEEYLSYYILNAVRCSALTRFEKGKESEHITEEDFKKTMKGN